MSLQAPPLYLNQSGPHALTGVQLHANAKCIYTHTSLIHSCLFFSLRLIADVSNGQSLSLFRLFIAASMSDLIPFFKVPDTLDNTEPRHRTLNSATCTRINISTNPSLGFSITPQRAPIHVNTNASSQHVSRGNLSRCCLTCPFECRKGQENPLVLACSL